MEMTTATRRLQKATDIPAAARIISGEEINRLSVENIASALRLSSSLQVARIDARQWAISARGFNSSTANKLQVMIDGRTIYTPLYSGVFWDVQDTYMPDLDRIEIIRGPSGTLWGANAVNGVINIKTKSSHDPTTQGFMAYAGGGTEARAFGGIRYGDTIDSSSAFRAYLKYFNRDDSKLAAGGDAQDSWNMTQGGFRVDMDLSPMDELTVQGDAYGGSIDQPSAGDILVSGGNVLGRWTRSLASESDLAVQVYYDYTHRDHPGTFSDDLHTVDFDLQHYFLYGKYTRITWGAGYRFWADRVGNTSALAFIPADLFTDLFSGFAQAEISLVPTVLQLTLGSKFEHNSFSGFEYQPGLRLGYTVSRGMLLWGAVSRAVRSPSRIDRDFYVPGQPPYQLAGGSGFVSEELTAYELGYNAQLSHRSRFAVAAFLNIYDNLRSVEPGPPLVIMNGLEGETYGVEVSLEWEAMDRWVLLAGWNYFRKELRLKPWSMDVNMGQGEGNDPSHRAHLTSRMDISDDLHLDAHLRFVGELMNPDAGVPAYAELDVTLGWAFSPDFSLDITGSDLLHDEHPEFGPAATRRLVERGVRAKLVWNPAW